MLLLIFGCKVPLNITNTASGFKVFRKELRTLMDYSYA